ncbi:GatB/YqeY domain-containing protein [uncultured Pseudokineococcus sp.]|uniref:GatB/YqeY domain-containing protein n=1 Tax=uncultured Pseudokineococcus sp. TaxID=1642928 RepID=UPI002608F9D7|nr:GatB/YqeY domain-containing protein [uncultured Pseudokineococcus sp.]
MSEPSEGTSPDDVPAGLAARIRTDLTTSMRARDELRTTTLRSLLTAVRTAEVAGTSARELSDEEVLAVLRSEAKKRRESSAAFAEAGRAERAEREAAEEAVIGAYLPAQLDDAALEALVAEEVASAAAAGRTGPSAMGSVMGAVRPRVGQLAEGGRVAAEVRRQLRAG